MLSVPVRAVAAAVLAVLAVSGCSRARVPAVPSASPAALPAPSPCPRAAHPGQRWPADIPADFPRPPGAVITRSFRTQSGLRVVEFTTPMSLRDGVLFLIRALPAAGYVIGRGDAEATEADAPFAKGTVHGALRLTITSPCSTSWILAVAEVQPNGVSPLLPSHHPRSSPSSLPLG